MTAVAVDVVEANAEDSAAVDVVEANSDDAVPIGDDDIDPVRVSEDPHDEPADRGEADDA